MIRLLPYAVAGGPHHMAADEVVLEAAAAGTASLRFYGWSQATLSLGYFQPEKLRHEDERLARLPYVRRPSGGATLVHHHELTYALGLPAGAPWQSGASWLRRMHTILAAALAELGVAVRLHEPTCAGPCDGFLCFRQFAAGDLLLGDAKVAGSAQRKQRKALLQHGAVLLAGSPHTPALPGIRALTGRAPTPEETAAAVARAFVRETGWELRPGDWAAAEPRRIQELVADKYTQDGWNRKR